MPAGDDLTGDGLVDLNDQYEWVARLKFIWLGDVDLIDVFDTLDFVAAFVAGKHETADQIEWAPPLRAGSRKIVHA